MSRYPSPSFDTCINELEEQRYLTQSTFEQKVSDNTFNVACASQGKPRARDMSKIQCFSCKEFGHTASQKKVLQLL